MNSFLPKILLPTAIIGTAAVVSYTQAAYSIDAYKIAEIAETITVIIRGPGSDGSGTIIARDGRTYFVLTAAHVVQDISPGEEADVQAFNKRLYPINTRKIQKIDGTDLAVVQFTGDESFEPAEIGNSENLGQLTTIYVAGYPLPDETQALQQAFQITKGDISGINTFSEYGYDLVYTNVTKAGMSGGPILNENGQLIGIHGKAAGSRLDDGKVLKEGFNLGIPIQVFVAKADKLGLKAKIKINYLYVQDPTNLPSPQVNNQNTPSTPTPTAQITPTPEPTPAPTPKITVTSKPDPTPSVPPPVPISPQTEISPLPAKNPSGQNSAELAYRPNTSAFKFLRKFTADDGNSGDLFGFAVAMNSNRALIGSAYSDTNGKADSGAVYLFDLGQQLRKKFAADDGTNGNVFGHAVAIEGNYALVGSAYNDRRSTDSGLAYLIDLNSGEQRYRFSPEDNNAGDLFGYSVGISGRYAVVGAPYNDGRGDNSGAAYVFDTSTGQQLQKLNPEDNLAGDMFGYAVAVQGQYAIVSSPYNDQKGTDSGAIYLFDLNTGRQIQKYTADDGRAGDVFGRAVAMNGNYVLVGAAYSDARGHDSGSAYLLDLSQGKQIRKFSADEGSAGDLFGWSVALNNRYAVIGAAYNDRKGHDSGAVYLFDLASGQQVQTLNADDASAGDVFGHSVAISGNYALVGSAYDDDNGQGDNGSAYLFDLTTGQQIQKF
jgi:S1-C subfamily serine protease